MWLFQNSSGQQAMMGSQHAKHENGFHNSSPNELVRAQCDTFHTSIDTQGNPEGEGEVSAKFQREDQFGEEEIFPSQPQIISMMFE
jgi:hypothetical protein